MNRDDFVGIVVGVGCKKCLSPSFEDVIKYNTLPFVDFDRKSENFYCVSYAKEKGIVEGYPLDATGKSSCEDEKSYTEAPFCAYNKISRIEATAVLLRQAGLWTKELNTSSFERKETISDVSSEWYGYAQKGITTGLIQRDSSGNIRPNESISKKEFVRMAAKILTVNLCEIREDTDPDKDGLSSSVDSCPTLFGPVTNAGCPLVIDTDGDGVLNADDLCPLVVGPVSNKGCPTQTELSSEVRVLDKGATCSLSTPSTDFLPTGESTYTLQ